MVMNATRFRIKLAAALLPLIALHSSAADTPDAKLVQESKTFHDRTRAQLPRVMCQIEEERACYKFDEARCIATAREAVEFCGRFIAEQFPLVPDRETARTIGARYGGCVSLNQAFMSGQDVRTVSACLDKVRLQWRSNKSLEPAPGK
jgi:hypothetical protein